MRHSPAFIFFRVSLEAHGPASRPNKRDAITRTEQRQDEVVRLQKEMMDMVAKLSGRVTKLEREPPNMSTEASREVPREPAAAQNGMEELEHRLAGFRTALSGEGAHAAPAAGRANQGISKTKTSEDSKTAEKADEISTRYRRMEHLSKNPLNVLLPLAKRYRDLPDWPFAGTCAGDRVAPPYLASSTLRRG